MGWGIEFKADIYISKQSFNSINDVKNKIESIKNLIEVTKKDILIIASSRPSDCVEKDEVRAPAIVSYDIVNDDLELLGELYNELFLLKLLKDNFDDKIDV